MCQAIATIVTNSGSRRVESGIWENEERAQAELRYLMAREIPMRESFKVVQQIKHIQNEY